MKQREVETQATGGGAECIGQETQEQACKLLDCPIDCVWGPFSAWSGCSVTCGDGNITRTREHAISAQYGGAECVGDSEENQHCNPYDDLVVILEANAQTIAQLEAEVAALQAGNGSTGSQTTTENPLSPPVDEGTTPAPPESPLVYCSAWGEWDSWSGCNKECGSGTMNRTRSAINQHGDSCGSTFAEQVLCNTSPCDLYDVWINTTGMKSGYCFDDFCTDQEVCKINKGDTGNSYGYYNMANEDITVGTGTRPDSTQGQCTEDEPCVSHTMEYDPSAGTAGFRFNDIYGGIFAVDSGAEGAILSPGLAKS